MFDDSGAVGGTLVVSTETTSRVMSERRAKTMRMLSEKSAWATDTKSLLHMAIEVIGAAPYDIPFALFYCDEGTPGHPHLLGGAGFQDEAAQAMADARIRPILQAGFRESQIRLASRPWSRQVCRVDHGPSPRRPSTSRS